MNPAYFNFSCALYGFIQMEARARFSVDRNGFQCHFDASEGFPFLASLARFIASDVRNYEALTEPEKNAVAFILHIDTRRFHHFLQNLHGRYYIAERFYPLCVEEYCFPRRESCPLLQWTAETFREEKIGEEAGGSLSWNDILTASFIQTYGD